MTKVTCRVFITATTTTTSLPRNEAMKSVHPKKKMCSCFPAYFVGSASTRGKTKNTNKTDQPWFDHNGAIFVASQHLPKKCQDVDNMSMVCWCQPKVPLWNHNFMQNPAISRLLGLVSVCHGEHIDDMKGRHGILLRRKNYTFVQ